MSWLRTITLVFAVILQAVPAGALDLGGIAHTGKACDYGCCAVASELEARESGCGCLSAPESQPSRSAPDATLPATAGRDLVPPAGRVLLADLPRWEPVRSIQGHPFRSGCSEDGRATRAHVRLPVLFCSLLT